MALDLPEAVAVPEPLDAAPAAEDLVVVAGWDPEVLLRMERRVSHPAPPPFERSKGERRELSRSRAAMSIFGMLSDARRRPLQREPLHVLEFTVEFLGDRLGIGDERRVGADA